MTTAEAPTESRTEISAELEAMLLEQEHRSIRVLQNFFSRKQWQVGDPRRQAVKKALLWWALSPASAAAAGGAVAAGTLLIMLMQTNLLREQNAAFREQNQKIQNQIEQQGQSEVARRRTDAIGHIFATDASGTKPLSDPRTRAESVAEFALLERSAKRSLITGSLVDLRGADLAGLNLSGRDLSYVDLSSALLTGTDLSRANMERAQLYNVSAGGALFVGANLKFATLRLAPRGLKEESDLFGASFNCADLRSSDLEVHREFDFMFADLREAVLFVASADHSAFRGANIAGSELNIIGELPQNQFADLLVESGAIRDPLLEWKRPDTHLDCLRRTVQARRQRRGL